MRWRPQSTHVPDQDHQAGATLHRSRPDRSPGGAISSLQTSIGNRAVARVLAAGVSPGSATPPDVTAVQRKVLMGLKQEEYQTRNWLKRRQGTGPHHNVGQMIDSTTANYYFTHEREMLAYANKKTENMGYLEKEDTWFRLPGELLVLGEMHDKTTVLDVVKAAGTRRYRHEGFNDVPPELLASSKRMRVAKGSRDEELREKAGDTGSGRDHSADALLPKTVVGLTGLRGVVEAAVKKSKLDEEEEPTTAPTAKKGKGKGKEEAYTRKDAERRMLMLGILTAAKSAKYSLTPQPLWTEYQAVFNETAKHLREEKPLERTPFIEAIAAGRFTYEEFIDSFKDAAVSALADAGLEDSFNRFQPQHADLQATQQKDAHPFERMREFYMMGKIREALGAGDRLFGMGDVHRGHIEHLLDKDGIHVQSLTSASLPSKHPTFVEEQNREYPQ